jgi:hypothetical protein
MTRPSLRLGVLFGAALLAGAMSLAFAWALRNQSYNVWGALVVVPVVVAINALLILRVCRRADEPWLLTVLAWAYGAKLAAAMARYLVAYVLYSGAADAERYNRYAAYQHTLWREGSIVWEWGGKQGTQYMELITTAVYTVIGPSPLAGFVVFATLGFWGQYLLFRAFRVAVPAGDGRRYALLVLFLPSMLYWPSSIGKEAWLLLFVGVTALGAARFLTGTRGALALLATGAVGMAAVRPHIAVLLFAALVVAQLSRPTRDQSAGILGKAGGLLVLGAAAWVLGSQSAAFLGIDDLDWQAVSESVDWAAAQTTESGSAFTPVPIQSVWGIPVAVLTVVFRPLPWEAANVQMLVQSLEGVFLLVLTVLAWPRIRRLPALLRTYPYLVFCVVYSAGFIWAFSGFGNFGILARQRVLMIPFFLVLLALPSGRPDELAPTDELEERDAARL